MSHEADVDQAEALKRACVLRRKYLAQQRATLVIEAREPSNRPRLKFLVPRIKQITAQMDKLEVCEGMYEQVRAHASPRSINYTICDAVTPLTGLLFLFLGERYKRDVGDFNSREDTSRHLKSD
tara:strand:- start:788 stop:1159 length:372 start_codon:yes stop_codon:yes gene_type:complete